jgi:hypothetical protein
MALPGRRVRLQLRQRYHVHGMGPPGGAPQTPDHLACTLWATDAAHSRQSRRDGETIEVEFEGITAA